MTMKFRRPPISEEDIRVEYVPVKTHTGATATGTKVRAGTMTVIFTTKLTREEAIRRVMAFRKNPRRFRARAARVKGLEEAVNKFEEFNMQPPRRLLRKQVDLSVPFIRIGRVPVVTYESDKEGKKTQYAHETKNMPTLYAHPSKPIFIMLGGSIKVKDWLYD